MESSPHDNGYGDSAVLDARSHRWIAAAARKRIMSEQLHLQPVHPHLFRVDRATAVAETAADVSEVLHG